MATDYFGEQMLGLIVTAGGAYAVNEVKDSIENFEERAYVFVGLGIGLIYAVYEFGDSFPIPDDIILALGVVLILTGIEGV